MFKIFIHIRDVCCGLHHISKRGSGRLKRVLNIFPYLLNLSTHIALTNAISLLVARCLPRNINLSMVRCFNNQYL